MAITAISADWGTDPRIVRITTSDNLATITTIGYLTAQEDNIAALNNGAFEYVEGDLYAIVFSGGEGMFVRDSTDNMFVAETDPGSLSETLLSARIFVGNAGNIATGVALTGDIAVTNAGVSSIVAGVIVNADVNAGAAIDFSKLEPLASARIVVGSGANIATEVAVTGDVTISNTGVTAIGAATIDLAMLSAGITPSHVVKFAAQITTVGGAAAENFAVIGVLITDFAYVQIVNNGAANVTALQAVCTADNLAVTFSADPTNDVVFNYQILRASV